MLKLDETKIIELRIQNKNLKEIATTLGCSKSTVSKYCNLHGMGKDWLPKKEADYPTKEELVSKMNENLKRKELADHFKLTDYQVQYLFKKYRISLGTERNRVLCSNCNKQLTEDDFYQNSNGLSHTTCKECLSEQIRLRQQQTKLDAVAYKGGKCAICGYDKCIAALDFHHLDPSEKDPKWTQYKKRKLTEEFKAELDKCILVCANCHRELHHCNS